MNRLSYSNVRREGELTKKLIPIDIKKISNTSKNSYYEESINILPTLETREKLIDIFLKKTYPYIKNLISITVYEKNIKKYEDTIYNSTKYSQPKIYYISLLKPLFFLDSTTSVYTCSQYFKKNFNTGYYDLENLRSIKHTDLFPELFLNNKLDPNVLTKLIDILNNEINDFINCLLKNKQFINNKFNWNDYILDEIEFNHVIDSCVYVYSGSIKKIEISEVINNLNTHKIKNKQFIKLFNCVYPNLLNELKKK